MKATRIVVSMLVLVAVGACSKKESNESTPAPEAETRSSTVDENATPTQPDAAKAEKAEPTMRDAAKPAETVDPKTLALGREAFETAMCRKCHGNAGKGTGRAPDLTDDEWLHTDGSIAGIRAIIVSGVPREKLKDPNRPYPMNPVTNFIEDEKKIDALAAYVHSLSHTKG